MSHQVVITGIGLISSLGVGAAANWAALAAGGTPVTDSRRFAPYTVHPAPQIDWSEQIPKRGDQRQMEAWQRLGTFAAGLALDDAGIKSDEALTGTMDLHVGAGGGERDVEVDTMILAEAAGGRSDTAILVNEKLTTELRPTLFLAQLPNLLAGNISIVHKVTGASRTMMGEEGAGMAALETAAARIVAGQSTHALVGGSYNAEHPDMLLGYELSGHLAQGPWAPVFARTEMAGGGMILGSGAAFVVLEEANHARKRGAGAYARLGTIASDSGPADEDATLGRLERLAGAVALDDADMIISAASGAKARAAIEARFLRSRLPDTPLRVVTSQTGHMREAQMPLGIAAAALSLKHGTSPGITDPDHEAATQPPRAVGVLTLGFEDAECAAKVHAVEEQP